MTFHLVQTECPEYPPFAGEFLVEITPADKLHYIECPPFKRAAYQQTHDPVDEILREYLKDQGATLVAYWPVIYKQHVTTLPACMQPVCYIECTFDARLATKLADTDKYYRCQLPAARCLVQQYMVSVFVDEQKTTPGQLMMAGISPTQVKDVLEYHWRDVPIQVEVKDT